MRTDKLTLEEKQMLLDDIEFWKPVNGFDKYYSVSSFGNIKSTGGIIKTKDNKSYSRKSKLMIPDMSSPYKRVTLYNETGKKKYSLHRIVADVFIDNPENKPHVNHLDGVKFNCKAVNLEWCTISENAIHALKNGLRKDHTGMKRSDETKLNISKSTIGRIPWNKKDIDVNTLETNPYNS